MLQNYCRTIAASKKKKKKNKQESVYTWTVSMGKSRTAFLGLQDLQDGSAVGILAAYTQVMLRAGVTVEEWISRVFWYCADGAVVMQSTENGVAALLMQLQCDVPGHSVIVPVHANCHRADLAFRDAMDSSHEFPDVVSNTMNLVVTWYNNTPTRLWNMRRMSWALEISPLQYSSLGQSRWAAFAARVVVALLRTYPAMVCAGKNGDTGTHEKHQSKDLKFLVHQQRPSRSKIGTLVPTANIRLKI